MGLLIFYLLLALVVSFLCSIMEATLLSTPFSFITMKEEEGSKAAKHLRKFKQDIDRPISAILTLNTVANTAGAAGVGKQAALVLGEEWFGWVSAGLTLLILVFSEIIPKTLGANHWRRLVIPMTPVYRALVFHFSFCFDGGVHYALHLARTKCYFGQPRGSFSYGYGRHGRGCVQAERGSDDSEYA